MSARDSKRQRISSEMELDDSVVSLISEFRLIPDPSNKDIGEFLAAFAEKSLQVNSDIRDLRAKVDELEDKVDRVRTDVDTQLKATTTKIDKQNLEVEHLKPTDAAHEKINRFNHKYFIQMSIISSPESSRASRINRIFTICQISSNDLENLSFSEIY
jgi:hypothetical protein